MNSNAELNVIAALDLAPIKVKLMHKESGEGWSLERVTHVEAEYRRFLQLLKLYPDEHVSPQFDVDIFWHYHILDTLKYAVDCEKIFGYFLHHYPYSGLGGAHDEAEHHRTGARMQELYEATFDQAFIRQGEGYPVKGLARSALEKIAYCSPMNEEAALSYCSPMKAETAAAYCSPLKAETTAAYCSPMKAETTAAYCSPMKAETALSYCSPMKAENDLAYCSPMKAAASAYCSPMRADSLAYCSPMKASTHATAPITAYCSPLKATTAMSYCSPMTATMVSIQGARAMTAKPSAVAQNDSVYAHALLAA